MSWATSWGGILGALDAVAEPAGAPHAQVVGGANRTTSQSPMTLPELRRALERRPALAIAGAVVCVLVIGWVDRLSGDHLSFSLFYLAPVALVAWLAGLRAGLLLAGFAAATSLVGDLWGLPTAGIVPLWNALVRWGVLGVVAIVLDRLRTSLEAQRRLANTDPLTEVLNPRAFEALAERELARSLRYGRPLSLAYIDLDGFKHVNDTLGHSIGDRLLREVSAELVEHVRPTDAVARMGGDEFAILMPETSLADAKAAMARIHDELVGRMLEDGWAVSFSVGTSTCTGVGCTVDAMIADADRVMYEHKARRAGRVGVLGTEA